MSNPQSQKRMAQIQADYEVTPNDPLPEEYLHPIKELWDDAGVQRAITKGNEFALHDNLD